MTGAAAPAHVPVRTRSTVISYAQIALYGWFLYAFGTSVALLRDEKGLSRSVASLHGTMFAVGAVTVGLVGHAVVRRLGRGRTLRLGSVVLALGLLVYCSGGPLAVTLIGALLCGLGGSFVVVFVTSFLSEQQGAAAPSALNEANGLGAVAGLVGPLVVGAGVALGWGWRPGLLVVVLGLLAVELWRGRTLPDYGIDDPTSGAEAPGPMPGRYWWAWLTLVCLIGVEFCLTLWSADLLRDRAGLGPAAAAASLATVVGGMAVGRLTGAQLAHRVDPERLLVGAILLAAAGFLLAWSSTLAAVMLAGYFVCGLGVGLHFPLGIGRCVRASDGHPDQATARSSLGGGLASGLAPFALAALADTAGVHTAFLTVPVLLGAALALVLLRPVPADAGLPQPTR